jgi:DNA-binding protein HU-beta
MNKTDLVAKVQELAELESKAAAERAVSAVLEALTAGLKSDSTVALVGFGTFDVKERKARTGVNPATGEKIKIAASKTVGFKAGKALKDEFNKAKPAKAAKKK